MIERGPINHVSQHHCASDHIAGAEAVCFQSGYNIVHDLFEFRVGRAIRQVKGAWYVADLAGEENEIAGCNALAEGQPGWEHATGLERYHVLVTRLVHMISVHEQLRTICLGTHHQIQTEKVVPKLCWAPEMTIRPMHASCLSAAERGPAVDPRLRLFQPGSKAQ